MSERQEDAWDAIHTYREIIESACKARDVGDSLSSVTEALCAIGLDLRKIIDALADAGKAEEA